MKVLAILANGFEECEASSTITLLVRANVIVDIYSFNSEATGKQGLTLSNLNLMDNLIDYTQYDALFLSGGPHYKILNASDKVKEIITYFFNNKKIGCICAAPTILGRMGLLQNKKYTCFTNMNKDFGGIFTDCSVTVDGNLITGKSVASSIDFGLAFIQELCGKEECMRVKEQIYY